MHKHCICKEIINKIEGTGRKDLKKKKKKKKKKSIFSIKSCHEKGCEYLSH